MLSVHRGAQTHVPSPLYHLWDDLGVFIGLLNSARAFDIQSEFVFISVFVVFWKIKESGSGREKQLLRVEGYSTPWGLRRQW